MFWVVGCRDNDARRFARVKKHYYSRRYGENDIIFSKRQASIQSEVGPLNPAMGFGERYELPHRGPGRTYSSLSVRHVAGVGCAGKTGQW